MRIWHISDTHCNEKLLTIPPDIDLIIHSGDATNNRTTFINFNEMKNFIEWYKVIPIKNKIYVAGNHDTSVYNRQIIKQDFESEGIIYLELESIEINGLKIFGNPYTPTYKNWAFMKDRGKLTPIYDLIPNDTNILISHGPPKGILDSSVSPSNVLEQCGCKELSNRIKYLKDLKLVAFGHIHSRGYCINHGIRILDNITYSNGAVVEDGKMGQIIYNGSIIEL